MSKVLVVNPPRFKGMPVIREDRCENVDVDCVQTPTSLVYIAGILKEQGHEVRIIDPNGQDYGYETIESMMYYYRPDWTVFRSTVSTFEEDTIVATLAKKYDSKSLLLNWNLQ